MVRPRPIPIAATRSVVGVRPADPHPERGMSGRPGRRKETNEMQSKRGISILIAVAFALGALAFDAPVAAAATDQLQDKAVKTYELQPDRGVVHVTTVFTLTNKAPSKTGSRTCSGYVFDPYSGSYVLVTGTCRTRTDYYYNEYNFWVEKDATSFKAKGNSGSAKVKLGKKKGDYRKAKLVYSRAVLRQDPPDHGELRPAGRRSALDGRPPGRLGLLVVLC